MKSAVLTSLLSLAVDPQVHAAAPQCRQQDSGADTRNNAQGLSLQEDSPETNTRHFGLHPIGQM